MPASNSPYAGYRARIPRRAGAGIGGLPRRHPPLDHVRTDRVGVHEVRRLGAEPDSGGFGPKIWATASAPGPGLAPYLLGELATAETDVLRRRWAEAMAELTQSLADEQFEDVQLANRLTILELPNLLGMLDWFQDHLPPEQLVDLAAAVEQLVSRLGRPQALARATRVRQQAAQKLGDSSRDRYRALKLVDIAQLLRQGDLAAANTATRQLLDHAVVAGENAYPDRRRPRYGLLVQAAYCRRTVRPRPP